jgi:hypothetical protein
MQSTECVPDTFLPTGGRFIQTRSAEEVVGLCLPRHLEEFFSTSEGHGLHKLHQKEHKIWWRHPQSIVNLVSKQSVLISSRNWKSTFWGLVAVMCCGMVNMTLRCKREKTGGTLWTWLAEHVHADIGSSQVCPAAMLLAASTRHQSC